MTNTIEKAAGASNTNGLHTDTNSADFRSQGAINQAPDGKAIANLIARLAMSGHQVTRLESGYLVSRWGLTKVCPDLQSLAQFARHVGIRS